jgi:hypothetical protein
MSIREFTSQVINTLNSTNLDDRYSREFLYWIGVNVASKIIKHEADSRKLFKNTSLFSKLECVEMESVSSVECDFNVPCSSIMKSVKKLPDAFLSNFGSLVQIFNIMRDKEYKEITPSSFKNISNQKYKPRNTAYFWLSNGYLYVPNSEVEVLIVQGMFSDVDAVNKFNGDNCKSALDSPFPAPDYMISTIIDATINQASNRKKVNSDSDSNINNLDKA